jgi:Tol biopolymer transport system component
MDVDRQRRAEEVYREVVACPPKLRATVLDQSCSGDAALRAAVESLLADRDNAGEFLQANNSEHWKQVQEIYHCVLAFPPDGRAAALDEFCTEDAGLRTEVQSLLEAREDAGDFLSPGDLLAHIEDLGSSPVAAPAISSALGPYRIVSPLGAGGMGEVYRARDTRLAREVALKILRPHLTHNAARVSRFRLEAQAASALNHPNIVTTFDIGEENGIWFIASELIEGVTLRERMAYGKLPVDEAIRITIQCAAALDAAHRAGIVHRDIKPENLMLRRDGVVKVVDFGLASITVAGEEPARSLTESGGVMGTPRYMSPEQARGQKPDQRSDVFSLGAVLYEMVAGLPAFPGSTAAEVFAALLSTQPQPGDRALDPILSRALQKNRDARYSTMKEFADDLRNLNPKENRLPRERFRRAFGAPLFPARTRQALLLLPLVAVAATYVWTSRREISPEGPLNVVPLTTFRGSKDDPALSPDGSRIAFSWRPSAKGPWHIYIKPVGAGEPVQLTASSSDDGFASWSPDGRQIAFCRRAMETGYDSRERVPFSVYIVPALGGAERKIAQTWAGVSWSADGQKLALARVPNNTPNSGGIDVLSLESGERHKLTASEEDILPAFSPSGKWIAFTRLFPGRGLEIFVVPAEGGPPRQLTFDGHLINGVTWTGDSREIVFSSLRNQAQGELWRIPVTGGAPRPLPGALRNASSPSVSPLSGRLAFTESWTDTNVYLRSGSGFARTGMPGRFGEPTGIVVSTRGDHSPAFSPDGERIVFASSRTGNEEIWTSRRDGSEAVQLTRFGEERNPSGNIFRQDSTEPSSRKLAGSPRWSPDGLSIAFDLWTSGESNIFVMNSHGGAPQRLSPDRGENWMPAWSPDGEWIYFTSRRSGTREIWKMPAGGGAATQVTHSGGYEVRPAPDGESIYFSKRTAARCCAIWHMPARGGPEKPVRELEKFTPISRSWGVLQQGIYFISRQDAPPLSVRFLSFATGLVTEIARQEKEPGWTFPAIAMSADGRHLLTVQIDREVNDLMMIENFD